MTPNTRKVEHSRSSINNADTPIPGGIGSTLTTDPHIKEGYVLYNKERIVPLSNHMTINNGDSPPEIIKDCPKCGGLNTGRVILVENTDHKGRIRPQYDAVGEICVNDHCDHKRP